MKYLFIRKVLDVVLELLVLQMALLPSLVADRIGMASLHVAAGAWGLTLLFA